MNHQRLLLASALGLGGAPTGDAGAAAW